MIRTTPIALGLFLLAACGGAQRPVAPEPTQAAPVDAGVSPAPAAVASFDSLSHEEKVRVMTAKVVPTLGKLFREHDAKKYEKFGCVTCHGPTRKQEPDEVLPKLTLSNGGFEKLAKREPEVVKFMSEKVVPAMAAALGEKPYDPNTKEGFGCGGCHKVE